MALPTMPAAVMLLQLGSLSNLMMTNTAVFLTCSLPKKPNNYLEEEKKVICLLFCSSSFHAFFLTLKRLWKKERGEWEVQERAGLDANYLPTSVETTPLKHSPCPAASPALLLPPTSPAFFPNSFITK